MKDQNDRGGDGSHPDTPDFGSFTWRQKDATIYEMAQPKSSFYESTGDDSSSIAQPKLIGDVRRDVEQKKIALEALRLQLVGSGVLSL